MTGPPITSSGARGYEERLFHQSPRAKREAMKRHSSNNCLERSEIVRRKALPPIATSDARGEEETRQQIASRKARRYEETLFQQLPRAKRETKKRDCSNQLSRAKREAKKKIPVHQLPRAKRETIKKDWSTNCLERSERLGEDTGLPIA